MNVQKHVSVMLTGYVNNKIWGFDGLRRLGALCVLTAIFVMAVSQELLAMQEPTETEFYDILSVGNVTTPNNSLLAESVYDELIGTDWIEGRTIDFDKSEGLDIRFVYPSSMEVNAGRQQNIICKLNKSFRFAGSNSGRGIQSESVVQLGVNIGVATYDSATIKTICRLKQNEVLSSPSFLDFIKTFSSERLNIIGAGVTTLQGRQVLWITMTHETERLGINLKTVSRSFFFPVASTRCAVVSYAIATNCKIWPYLDFKLFNIFGLRFVNNLVFADRSQIYTPISASDNRSKSVRSLSERIVSKMFLPIGFFSIYLIAHLIGWIIAKVNKVRRGDKTATTFSDATTVVHKRLSLSTILIVIVIAFIVLLLTFTSVYF